MRIIQLSFIVFLFVLNETNAQQRDCKECLAWSESRPLRWSDFKGTPKRSSQEEAMTDSGMSIELKCDGKTSTAVIKSYFNPLKSWTKDKQSAYLLRHEQLHFDITELFVRRLRAQLVQFGDDCEKLNAHLEDFYNRNYKEFVAYQDRYDRESNHSINKEKQAYWEEKVAKELAELKPYASYANN